MEEILNNALTIFVAASSLAGKSMLEEAAKDAYGKLRDFLTKKARPDDVKALEENVDDDLRQKLLIRELGNTVDEADVKTLVSLAEALSQALKAHHEEVYDAFDLQRNEVKGSFDVTNNELEDGARIKAQDNKVGRNFNISGNKSNKS